MCDRGGGGGGSRERWEEGGEREKKRRGWRRRWWWWQGESRFGEKSSSVGNYQSLRNADAALTRQAAAWLQWPHSTPTCITPSADLCTLPLHTHTHPPEPLQVQLHSISVYLCHYCLTALLCLCSVYFYHCHYLHSLFLKLYPLCTKQRDHIMSVRGCLSVQVLHHCVFMLICWFRIKLEDTCGHPGLWLLR